MERGKGGREEKIGREGETVKLGRIVICIQLSTVR